MRAVALSGGADSVVVFHKMLKSGLLDCAIHMNYNLRGEESLRDRDFCIELCKKFNVKLDLYEVENVEEQAILNKKGLEEYARDLRYEIFNKEKYSTIYLGHHKDDLVETILFRIVRGTGLNGMEPMKLESGKFKRPLLNLSKTEILEYIEKENLSFITDSSNLTNDYTRNIIRNEICPILNSININYRNNIISFTNNVNEAYDELKLLMTDNIRLLVESGLDIQTFKKFKKTTQHTILLEGMKLIDNTEFFLGKNDFSEILKLIETSNGGYRKVRNVYILMKKGKLLLTKNRYENQELPKNYEELGIKKFEEFEEYVIINNNKKNISNLPLIIRHFEEGDYIKVNNMTKKMKNYLDERGVYSFEKKDVYVLAQGKEILWVKFSY